MAAPMKHDIPVLVQCLRSAADSRCYPAAAASLLLREAPSALSANGGN